MISLSRSIYLLSSSRSLTRLRLSIPDFQLLSLVVIPITRLRANLIQLLSMS